MRFFKKEHQQGNLFTTDYHQTAEELQQQKSSNTRADTLTHVMHLFEEKNKYPPTPGQLPIKANGAIVVNRPSNRSQGGTIRSLPLYLQKDDDEEEEEDMGEIKMMVADEGSSDNNSSTIEEEEEMDMTNIVHEENKRLRQQILMEREQHEKWRLAQEKLKQELTFAHQTIKNLQQMTDRFQKLLLHLPHHAAISKRVRRQSTPAGVTTAFDYTYNSQQQIPYERKLQILLNEIDAMEIQEKEAFKCLTLHMNENEKLHRKLKYKDDIIRQLAYDLQYKRCRS
jgi:hypothetical protein